MIHIYIIFISLLFSQRLITEVNEIDKLRFEYEAIESNKISDKLFFSPFIQDKPSDKVVSVGYKHFFQIEPTFAIRSSLKGFEMYNESYQANTWYFNEDFVSSGLFNGEFLNADVVSPMLWISPGIKIHSTIPILTNFTNIWIYNWSTFYKHSSYGFDSNKSWVDKDTPLFYYDNEYSIEYYEPTQSPDNGIDFDEGQSGISILSNNFQLIFGKFQTNIGPFYNGNLSISDNAPSFTQFLAKVNFDDKIYFSYLVGSLTSNISKSYESEAFTDQWGVGSNNNLFYDYISASSEPMINRYVINHRFDFLPIANFRIGLYEQIICGGDSVPWSYLVPLNPLFSAQHATNDQDNLQIGLDLEYIFNKSRFTFALMMDEWALYDTFKETERNWFAYQVGYSQLFELYEKSALFKIEYSYIDPGAYTHRFIINEPKHQGYNLGYWSNSNSDNLTLNTTFFLSDSDIFLIEYKYTRFGLGDKIDLLEQQYENELGVDHLSGGYISKNELAFIYSKNYKGFFLDFEYKNTNHLRKYYINCSVGIDESLTCSDVSYNNIIDGTKYEEFSSEKIDDFRIKLRYNISK